MSDDYQPLVDHLARTTGLDDARARRVLDDVLAYLGEDLGAFVRRRHAELVREGLRNEAIYAGLAREVAGRRFAVPPQSARQIRRLIYG
jgi:hypothetical protein